MPRLCEKEAGKSWQVETTGAKHGHAHTQLIFVLNADILHLNEKKPRKKKHKA